MTKEDRDIYDRLKVAGYWLAQDIYKADGGISNIKELVKKYTGKMFNYIHNNKKDEFILYLQKIYAGISKQPHKELMEILREQEGRKLKEYCLAFMMGFMSKKEEKRGGKSESK